jgi:hypothetical protein
MLIRCRWDGPSMHEPASNAPITHDLRIAAARILGAAEGDPDKAAAMLKKLLAERAQIDLP